MQAEDRADVAVGVGELRYRDDLARCKLRSGVTHGSRAHHSLQDSDGQRRGFGVQAYRPEHLPLWSSGINAEPDSEYDTMVVAPNDAPVELRRSRAAYEALEVPGLRPTCWFGLQNSGTTTKPEPRFAHIDTSFSPGAESHRRRCSVVCTTNTAGQGGCVALAKVLRMTTSKPLSVLAARRV